MLLRTYPYPRKGCCGSRFAFQLSTPAPQLLFSLHELSKLVLSRLQLLMGKGVIPMLTYQLHKLRESGKDTGFEWQARLVFDMLAFPVPAFSNEFPSSSQFDLYPRSIWLHLEAQSKFCYTQYMMEFEYALALSFESSMTSMWKQKGKK